MTNTNTSNNSDSELGDTVNTRARDDLAKRIKSLVEAHGWTQVYASGSCGQSQP